MAALVVSAQIITAPPEAAHQGILPVAYRRQFIETIVEDFVFPLDPDAEHAKRIERCVIVRVGEAPALRSDNRISASIFEMPYVEPADPILRLRMNWEAIRRVAMFGDRETVTRLDWTDYNRRDSIAA